MVGGGRELLSETLPGNEYFQFDAHEAWRHRCAAQGNIQGVGRLAPRHPVTAVVETKRRVAEAHLFAQDLALALDERAALAIWSVQWSVPPGRRLARPGCTTRRAIGPVAVPGREVRNRHPPQALAHRVESGEEALPFLGGDPQGDSVICRAVTVSIQVG